MNSRLSLQAEASPDKSDRRATPHRGGSKREMCAEQQQNCGPECIAVNTAPFWPGKTDLVHTESMASMVCAHCKPVLTSVLLALTANASQEGSKLCSSLLASN